MPTKELRRDRNERLRGYIVYLLYVARPRQLELASLQRLLDRRNLPVSQHKLAEELDYLRGEELLSVTMAAEGIVKNSATIDWIERYADADNDELGNLLRARLTTKGVIFQESAQPHDGIQRVE